MLEQVKGVEQLKAVACKRGLENDEGAAALPPPLSLWSRSARPRRASLATAHRSAGQTLHRSCLQFRSRRKTPPL